jgi:hypothetical protein
MNFIKCTKEVLAEYTEDVETVRVLSDGDAIKHFELIDPVWMMAKDDERVQYWTEEGLQIYMEYVLGEGTEEA